MFGHNKITGQSYFNTAPKDKLLVTSRFFTLQGEGPFRGQPAYFIRLAKCNLACSFCDTYFDTGEWYDFDFLLQESELLINNFFAKRHQQTPGWASGRNKNIILVITGGEPSLQKNLLLFLEKAKSFFKNMQIETNGIIPLIDMPPNTTIVVSPKCHEKNNQIIKYLKPNSEMLKRADSLKFVISHPSYSKYSVYSEIPNWAHLWANDTGKDIFISPMNIYKQEPQNVIDNKNNVMTIDQRSTINEVVSFWEPGLLDCDANKKNHEYAAEYCMRYGYTLNLQIHLYASLP